MDFFEVPEPEKKSLLDIIRISRFSEHIYQVVSRRMEGDRMVKIVWRYDLRRMVKGKDMLLRPPVQPIDVDEKLWVLDLWHEEVGDTGA